MTTTKTLILAAVTALTLGNGAAYAQSEGHDAAVPYWTLQRQADALRGAEARNPNLFAVPAGSSDVDHFGVGHTLPFNGNFGTLANPG
jgi:hypothetical protein